MSFLKCIVDNCTNGSEPLDVVFGFCKKHTIEKVESEASKLIDQYSFLMRVFKATEFGNGDCLFWRTDEEYAPLSIFVNCNDLFYWGTADAEDLTQDNISVFEQAFADAEKAWPHFGHIYAPSLFCCRVRKMRPQHCCYSKDWPDKLKKLFDECGPERTAIDCG